MLMQALLVLALASSSLSSPALNRSNDDPVKRTTFGVAIAPVPESFRRLDYLEPNEGVVLVKVQPGGAAEAANLRDGDMVLAINGQRVDETTLFATLKQLKRGVPFRVEFLRKNRWTETTAVIDG